MRQVREEDEVRQVGEEDEVRQVGEEDEVRQVGEEDEVRQVGEEDEVRQDEVRSLWPFGTEASQRFSGWFFYLWISLFVLEYNQ